MDTPGQATGHQNETPVDYVRSVFPKVWYAYHQWYTKGLKGYRKEISKIVRWLALNKNKSVALQALTNLGRLSSRRWQSFPTTPDGTGLTSNPTGAFSTFQTRPLLLYSSNYSVYPITRLSGPRSRPSSLRKILRNVRESNPGPLCL
jgi:hypothetical protein